MKNKNIFVSIASYRDNKCLNTINDLFQKAKYPLNIFIGICQQNNIEIDKDCIYHNNIKDEYKNNIRIIRIPYYDARGPTFARYLCASLLDKNNETFFLQIDSHTIFIDEWDIKLINMIEEIQDLGLSKKPVISYYPKDFSNMNNENDDNKFKIPVIYNLNFIKKKGVFSLGQAIYTNINNSYIKTPYMTAGMFFCYSSFIDEIPFDPTLDYLFTGEEILNSIKFFTFGYDIFIPKLNIIFHDYERKNEPKYWNEPQIIFDDRKALKKVRYYLFHYDYNNKNPYYSNYKLGNIKTIDEFYKLANVNINKYKNNKFIIFISILIILFLIFYLLLKIDIIIYLYRFL